MHSLFVPQPDLELIHSDIYCRHLDTLNRQQPIIVNEDIYADSGSLLMTAGSRWNLPAADKRRPIRLDAPISHQINLDYCLTESDIYRLIQEHLNGNPELLEIHQQNRFEPILLQLCCNRLLPNPLRVHLTVMQHCLPKIFEHSLFCAWASCLIGRQLMLLPERLSDVFLCGLFHDIGLLYVPPEALDSSEPRSLTLWQQFQNHAEIGAQTLGRFDCLSQEIITGVREHHERIDRTGYPTRKVAEELGLFGQIVSATDILHKIKTRKLAGKHQPLTTCLPHLKSNQAAYSDVVYHAVFCVLAKAEIKLNSSDESESTQLHCRLQQVYPWLLKLTPYVIQVQSAEFHYLDSNEGRAVIELSHEIQNTFRHIGLDALVFQDAEDCSADALRQLDSAMYKLLALLKRFEWSLERLLTVSALVMNKSSRKNLATSLSDYQQILQGAWSHYGLQREPVEIDPPGSDTGPIDKIA
ncbi:MAG: HD domain-containing phosphohydrolase [Motiliproteus sp.]